MHKQHWVAVILTMTLAVAPSVFAAKEPKTDHPLVTPYAGSKLYSKDVTQFDEYRVFKGWNKEANEYDTETLEGKVTKILYKTPPERPDLELYVVGHTDMQGSLSHNMKLSEGRARAVVSELTTGYGIAAGRLEGQGIGPLAPVATNAGEGGRAKNRRVVLVQR